MKPTRLQAASDRALLRDAIPQAPRSRGDFAIICILVLGWHLALIAIVVVIPPIFRQFFDDILGPDVPLPYVTEIFYSHHRFLFILPAFFFLSRLVDMARFGGETEKGIRLLIIMLQYSVFLGGTFVLAMFLPTIKLVVGLS